MKFENLFLGFGFYGAGNIGDDLMLQGFLQEFVGASSPRLTCSLPAKWVPTQQKRFDCIDWLSLSTEERKEKLTSFDCWIGVGGTPFQATNGPWLLNGILSDFEAAPGTRKFMIGVGCEKEVLRERSLAQRILNMTDFIWTRDEASRKVLVDDLGADPKKVSLGGDLAHLSLRKIFPASAESQTQQSVGIVYFTNSDETDSRAAIKKFIGNFPSDLKPIFFANDVRKKGFEKTTYKELFSTWKRLRGTSPRFFTPDYAAENVEELVSHYRGFSVIMACRYHALLTAAWAGCRVVALDRSSKIRFLASELDIPLVATPFTEESLHEGFMNAKRVSRQLLESKCAAAELAIRDFCRSL